MIYSINEGFLGGNRPNKIILADIKAAEERIKDLIKFFSDNLKVITQMKNIVCKDDFTNSDADKIKACMKRLHDLETEFTKDKDVRRLTAVVNNLIRTNCRKSIDQLEFSEDTPEEYKALVKKVSQYGQYTKSMTNIANKFLMLNDDYTKMYKKRTELDAAHNKACEEFGGMVGYMIGSIPVVKLGLGKVDA